MAPIYSVTVNEMMPRFLEGDAAVRYCQSNIQYLVDCIGVNVNIMLKKGKYTAEETITALEFLIGCYKLLYPDGNCGFFHVRLSAFYKRMANNYMSLGNCDQMFDCLEKAVEHAIKFDTLKDGEYTAFMVNKLKMSSNDALKDHSENQSGLLLKSLKKDKFAHLWNEQRMLKIIEKLESIALM